MQNLSRFIVIVFILRLFCLPADAREEKGRAYYDFGVFAYEDGDYGDAEENFEKALEFNPDHPSYNHYMGKTYMKTERYPEADAYLHRAWKADPDIPGLKYDMAFLSYKMSDHANAAERFKAVAHAEPSNVLAHYYAGISLYKLRHHKAAVDYFIHASENSPTISANGYYYAGICYQKMGKIEKAAEKFEYVRTHAESAALRENAAEWLGIMKKQGQALRPYRLYLKIGRRYDDNVRLLPPDQDIANDRGKGKGDAVTVGYFSGTYKLVNTERHKIGLGYSHYQTGHDDLNEYDLTGSIFNLYAQYRLHPFILGLTYLPSYYWADSESYLRRHQLRSELIWPLSETLVSRFSYGYYDDDYLRENDRSGHTHEFSMDIYYSLPNEMGSLFGGLGYEKSTASVSAYDYGRMKAKMGMSLNLPWSLALGLTGKYYSKEYDNDYREESVGQDDGKYMGTFSLSRSLFYDWLSLSAEFSHTKNDSNISGHDYEKNMTTLSLTARY